MTTPDYANKIAALLAKANDPAATPEEAVTYSAKAEQLMVKWGISDAELDATRRKGKKAGEKIVEDTILLHGVDARSLIRIGFSIARGFGNVRTLQSSVYGSSRDKQLYLIGFESDVKRARQLYVSLEAQALLARDLWWRDFEGRIIMDRNAARRARRQFIWSFAAAIETRLTATREAAEQKVSTGTELVLVDRKTRVDGYVEEQYPSLTKARALMGSYAGREAGAAAGARASLNEARIAQTKQVKA